MLRPSSHCGHRVLLTGTASTSQTRLGGPHVCSWLLKVSTAISRRLQRQSLPSDDHSGRPYAAARLEIMQAAFSSLHL